MTPIRHDWLREDPATWPDYDEYCRMQKWVCELEVTNVVSERVVKNMQEVAHITRDLSHRDNVVLVMMTTTAGSLR